MKGKTVLALILIAGAAAAGGGYYYYNYIRAQEVSLASLYQTEQAAAGDVSVKVTATGNVHGSDELALFINSPQTVSKLHVKEGDSVQAGQLLIEYDITQDKRELERKLRESELNLRNAELNLELIAQPASGNELLQYTTDLSNAEKYVYDTENALKTTDIKISQQQLRVNDTKKTMDNNKKLLDGGIGTQNDYDLSVTAYQNALESYNNLLLQREADEKNLEARLRQVSEAQQKLENARDKFSNETNLIKYQQQQNNIRLIELQIEQIKDDLSKLTEQTVSPISGNVSHVGVTEGGTASKSLAVIKLTDLSSIIIKSDVTEYDAPLLELGQRAEISSSGLPDYIYHGTITKIASGAVEKDKSSGTEVVVPVEITVSNADSRLKTGYTVDIAMFITEKTNVLAVPFQAVLRDNGYEYVYTLNENELKKNEVVTGLRGDKTIEIISGINKGDNVIIDAKQVK